jgi:SOS-response transcriptional repressor LexA
MLSGPELGAALTAAMQKKGVGPSAVAEAFGVKPPSVKDWQQFGRLHKKHIPTLVSYFADVVGPEHWGLDHSKAQPHQPVSNVAPAAVGSRRIPLVSYVQAGDMTEVVDAYAMGEGVEFLLTDLDLSSNAFALRIKGDSMLPEFREGDVVMIDPAVKPQPGDFVVAKNGENEATFKKYRPRGIGAHGVTIFELVPLNEDYPSMRSDETPIMIIGTMMEHRRYRRR